MEYSLEVYKELEHEIRQASLHRPMAVKRYEPGTELFYDVKAVAGANECRVHLVVEKFVGGGFAGQVYRVKLLNIEPETASIEGLTAGESYALKILIPPSGFSRLFRNALFWAGFQGPFQLQVNPAAARAGALWHKFIRRGAKVWFGEERAVKDIYATFVDNILGSCGELSEWVEGRTWRLEVDEHLDSLKRWKKGKAVDAERLGSPEYRAKYEFMHKFVEMLHAMGAHEFARQYEWSTCKSQPNCLKREDTEEYPSEGLTAIDFRAGLALLPFLPMSPGDFKLIVKGVLRGSLVQFDRGDISKLEQFVKTHREDFADMGPMLEELKTVEEVYRNSIPDITHNHVRLFYSSKLWSTIFDSAATGWKVRNLVDDQCKEKLQDNRVSTLLFFMVGIIPLIGSFIRRVWGRKDWRKHYKWILTSWSYFRRSVRANIAEAVIDWHRSGRVGGERALKIAKQSWRFLCHWPLSLLPGGMHRFITDWKYAKERVVFLVIRPVRLYFNSELREQWLREMLIEGKKQQLLSDEDWMIILSQIKEPFIQKYLKSLAVHLCTLPVTQIVSVVVALIYVAMHPEMPRGQAWGIGLGIIALFQVVPISPGSIVRGLYVLYLVIRERNLKDYNIALSLGFFKYIGYLAFPIQMAYRYPTLARFMARHWATEAVHIVPVFGESGALLEHAVFSWFYNWPLTIRRRMSKRSQIRSAMRPRYWHIVLCALAGTWIFGLADFAYLKNLGELPDLRKIWWLVALVPMLCGAAVTLGAGGAPLSKRIIGATACGVLVGLLYTAMSAMLGHGSLVGVGDIATGCVWRVFIFTILSTIGLLLTELKLPEPRAR